MTNASRRLNFFPVPSIRQPTPSHPHATCTRTTTISLSITSAKQPLSQMAKSLRSKVKRSYRAKKRETGVYAAASAARLHRLHTKLAKVSMTDRASEDDEDFVDEEERIPGWLMFAMLDHEEITSESMARWSTWSQQGSVGEGRRRSSISANSDETDSDYDMC